MKDLIGERIRLGDEQAFELFFRTHYTSLCIFANKFLNDPDEAQNIVQDVFTKIWETREDINPEDSLKSYMFKIAQNLSLNKLARTKVESKYIDIFKNVYLNNNNELSVSDSLLAGELEKNISLAIEKLPDGCRKIFELSRVEGLKYNEIANILHISVKTVEAQISKALKTLRVDLKEYLTILIVSLLNI